MKKLSKFNYYSILLFTTIILTFKSHATTINIESKPILKITSTIPSINHELYINLDKITCKINYPYRTDAISAKLSSDNEFIILNNGAFTSIADLKVCDKSGIYLKDIHENNSITQDINKSTNLLVFYIDPTIGIHDKKSKFIYIAGIIVNEEIYGYGMLPDPLKINHKQFFSPDRNSNVDLDRSLFAGPYDKAFFSPNGKYLALKSSAISCKKGAYPGVFETTHWKQVIFNGPNSNKKCRALFPQLK
ncbi:hypothetical protein [Aquitalea sp. ASV15]|uniref:hypothetical protein n=1 Tax=Aquitalea sp. ASV15 TaxID=2795104 RepID=UPI0018ED9810|nr:hypothetical protein [Aquitalea sp. ASV15]